MYWGHLQLDRTIGIQYLIAFSQKVFAENNFSIYIPNIIAGKKEAAAGSFRAFTVTPAFCRKIAVGALVAPRGGLPLRPFS